MVIQYSGTMGIRAVMDDVYKWVLARGPTFSRAVTVHRADKAIMDKRRTGTAA